MFNLRIKFIFCYFYLACFSTGCKYLQGKSDSQLFTGKTFMGTDQESGNPSEKKILANLS